MASVSDTGSMRVLEHRLASELNGSYSYFHAGDVLLAKITPCFENNKIAIADIDTVHGFGSTEFHVIRAHPAVLDARYLLHFLRQDSVRDAGTRRMTGSAGQKRVPRLFLASLMIPLPPIDEQRRIAGILDQADDLRRKRSATIDRLHLLPQALFYELFGDPVANPRSFPLASLRDLGRVATGRTPPTVGDGLFGGKIPFMTPGDLASLTSARRTVTEAGAATVGTVRRGATLVCCIGATIGKMDMARDRCAFNQQINAVEWFSTIDDLYGYYALTYFRQSIAAAGASTTLPILKKSRFERIEIPVPPLRDQRRFGTQAAIIYQLEVVQRSHLAQLNALFASLEQTAFRGES